MIARIEPLTTTRRLSRAVRLRAARDGRVEVGSIVRVPFGRQPLDGVVVGLAETSELAPERLVAPTAVREDSVPPDLVELALWMADEYCSTPARALALVLPPPGKPRTEQWAFRTGAPADDERLTDNQRALLDALPAPPAASCRRCGGSSSAGSSRSRPASAAARRAPTSRRTRPSS